MTEAKSIGRQFLLEAEAASRGAEQLRSRVIADEQRDYASGTIWGRRLVNQQVAAIAERIEAKKARLTQGKAQQGATKLQDVIALIEPEVLAAIAAKRTLDLIGRSTTGDPFANKVKNTYTNVCTTVGASIEAEARFRWYQFKAPKEWASIKARYFLPTTGTRQKQSIASVMMNRKGFNWPRWTQAKRLQVGAYLLDCIAQTVNWFEIKVYNTKGKANALRVVVISPELKNLRDLMVGLAELQAPLTWPMLCEPAPWSNDQKGGYLTNELRDHFSLVRGQRGPLALGKTPIDMINTLQSVAYRINPVTYELMKVLQYRGLSLGKFCMSDNELPLPRPETEDKEVLFQWRRARADQENRNAGLRGKRYRTLETLSIADRFVGEEEFYIPWSFDYRGRVYPIPSYMSPQGTDMEKSLYLFAKARPLTSRARFWLAVHLANTAGKDKLTLQERVQWTEQHHDLIVAIATNPENNLAALESFSEPWCGLAACSEYYECVIACTKATTALPVATDATCSGLQHLAAMTLDGATGRLVNVSPTPSPQDAYRAVLHRTIELLQLKHPELAEWAKKVGRPLTKRVTMTVPYAATPHSNRGYIRQAIMEHEFSAGTNRRPSSEDLTAFTQTMLQALREIVPGPIAVMEWIKASVKDHIINTGSFKIEWVSPSGFPVLQDKRKPNIVRVKTQLLGDVIKSSVSDGYNEVDINKHCHSSAPNFIHSLDAALLHNSFAGFDKPFILIHDSILTTASDMDYMSRVIRDEFVKIYQDKPLIGFANILGAELPQGMIIGDLDIEHCLNSVYFFC